MVNRVLALRDLTAPLEKDAPWPGTALRGDPHTKTWNLYTSDGGKAPVPEAMRKYYVFALGH